MRPQEDCREVVDALTSRLAVAVGSVQSSATQSRTLRLRWNGTRWSAF